MANLLLENLEKKISFYMSKWSWHNTKNKKETGNDKSEVMEENMIVVSTSKGDFSFQSADEVLKFVQTAAQENSETRC